MATHDALTAANNALKALRHAVVSGDEKAVTELLAQEPYLLNARDNNFKTVLNYAVDSGHLAVVSALIARGPEEERANYHALRWAAREGHINLVVQIHANWPALISRKPCHVLTDAARNNQVEVVTQLLAMAPGLRVAGPERHLRSC